MVGVGEGPQSRVGEGPQSLASLTAFFCCLPGLFEAIRRATHCLLPGSLQAYGHSLGRLAALQ